MTGFNKGLAILSIGIYDQKAIKKYIDRQCTILDHYNRFLSIS